MTRSERAIKKLIAWIIAMLFHRVEVHQPPGLTSNGSQLANASHFGGFTDPVLLIYAMDRVPRFVARDVIWKVPIVRNILNWARAIPVHKSEDSGPSGNDQMFRSTYDALEESDIVTIFPEGVTVDDPRIANIKTGSARIALGARANGVSGITLLSAGIHYENKAALRSEAFVDVGYPLDLDTWVDENIPEGQAQDASNHDAVRALTSEMEKRLRWAAPDFGDWKTATALSAAAGVALREADGSELDVGHGDKQRLARLIAGAQDDLKGDVIDAMDVYQTELHALGYNDASFLSDFYTQHAFLRDVIKQLVVALVLLPMALVGAVVNAIPMAIVWLIGRLKVADAMMATLKPIGAIFAFMVTWGVWIWVAVAKSGGFRESGIAVVLFSLVLLPLYLFAVIALFERTILFARALKSLSRSRSIADLHERVSADRAAVVEAVAQAL